MADQRFRALSAAANAGRIGPMVTLSIQATGATIGDISDDDFRLLQSALEEEGPDDRDYWINLDTIDLIASRGASAKLVEILRNAVTGTPDGVEIGFEQQQ
jgi:hypothetical protein